MVGQQEPSCGDDHLKEGTTMTLATSGNKSHLSPINVCTCCPLFVVCLHIKRPTEVTDWDNQPESRDTILEGSNIEAASQPHRTTFIGL